MATPSSSLRKLIDWASSGQVVLVLVFAIICALAAVEFLRSRATTTASAADTAEPPAYLPEILSTTLAGTTPNMTFLAGDDRASAGQLWGVAVGLSGLVVRHWNLASARGPRVPGSTMSIHAVPGAFALTSWGPHGGPALLVAHHSTAGGGVVIISLNGSHRVVAKGPDRLAVPGRTETEMIAVGHWSGPREDLLVAYRQRTGVVEVEIWGGVLGTGERLATLTVRGRFPASSFSLIIAPLPIPRARPSLVWVSRNATATGRTEVHVMPGNSDFQARSEQAPTMMPDRLPQLRYTIGLGRSGLPRLFAIDPRDGRLRIFSFALDHGELIGQSAYQPRPLP